jgi:ech hydrogenase subunit F
MQDTVLAIWKTVARSLVSKPACKMYPAEPPVFYERTRGRIEMEAGRCIVCTLCAKKCPTGAIAVDKEKNTWTLDRFLCIVCGACAEGCKPGALKMVNSYTGPAPARSVEVLSVTPPKRPPRKEHDASTPAVDEQG